MNFPNRAMLVYDFDVRASRWAGLTAQVCQSSTRNSFRYLAQASQLGHCCSRAVSLPAVTGSRFPVSVASVSRCHGDYFCLFGMKKKKKTCYLDKILDIFLLKSKNELFTACHLKKMSTR